MDWSNVIVTLGALLISGFSVVLWTLFLGLRSELREIQRELAAHRLSVAEAYVTHVVLRQTMMDFESNLNRVIETVKESCDLMRADFRQVFADMNRRIDGKADKPDRK